MVILQKPWLMLSAKAAHSFSYPVLKCYGFFTSPRIEEARPFSWRGIHFSNPFGIAGGVDKNADFLSAFWGLGAGFLEVGTITPEAQGPNPGTIIDRDSQTLALWNKMGFPNAGIKSVKAKLQKLKRPYPTPLFINIGKNRSTTNEHATQDYLKCIREMRHYADVFVVNISSPNTSGLRQLLEPKTLTTFLRPLVQECAGKVPVLLKLSPDIDDAIWSQVLESSLSAGVDGWVIHNTTLSRTHTPQWPPEGGVSGRPLTQRSEFLLQKTVMDLGPQRQGKLIVSVGGVLEPKDVLRRLDLGADLVQTYSGLIFYGPKIFRDTARMMKQ